MQSCFCLIPLSTPPEPSAERTLGTTLHSRTSKAKQSSFGPQERLGAPIPNWRKQTLSLPTRQRGNRGARCQNRVRAHSRTPPGVDRDRTGSLHGRTLPPPPQTLLPYLHGGWESVSKVLPKTAPSTPLGSLWEGRTGRKSCGPDPRLPLLLLGRT